jgi:hypothetical protein
MPSSFFTALMTGSIIAAYIGQAAFGPGEMKGEQ